MSPNFCSSALRGFRRVRHDQVGSKGEHRTMEHMSPEAIRSKEQRDLQSHERRRVSASSKIKFLSRSWHLSTPRKLERPSILQLPPEIRNRIMQFALVPGDIYLPGPPPKIIAKARRNLRANDSIEAIVRKIRYPYLSKVLKRRQAQKDPGMKYGCQVLATCKQLYCEGYAMFYSLNTFHLAPGPLHNTTVYFDNLQTHHKALIKHVAFGLSVADLNPTIVSGLCARFSGSRFDIANYRQDCRAVFVYLLPAVAEIWFSKLHWLLGWETLAEIRMQHHLLSWRDGQFDVGKGQHFAKELVISLGESQKNLPSGSSLRWDKQIVEYMKVSSYTIIQLLMSRVAKSGWNGFAQWMASLEPGPVACLESKVWQPVRPLLPRACNLAYSPQDAA